MFVCQSTAYILNYLTPDLNLVRINLHQRIADTILLQELLKFSDFSFANPRNIVDDGISVWMTGQNGVLRYNYKEGTYAIYGVENGLAHSFTFSAALDMDRHVWIGSFGGIDRYDAKTDRFISVHKMFDNTYMAAFGSAVSTNSGILFFHFGNTIVKIKPELLKSRSTNAPLMYFNEVRVNGENINWEEGDRLEHLHFNENRLTFIYDMYVDVAPDLVSFQYRLNNRKWIDNGQNNELHLDGLAYGRYSLEVQGKVGSISGPTDKKLIHFRIHPPWWKTWWFIGSLLFSVLLVIIAYFRGKIEKYKRELFITHQITDLESKALRAQMNPHFVFNCLNAIQECIVTGKVEEAYGYLSKFSRLLRMVLEQSDMADISLQEELEVLNLYVSLEKLRFKDDMEYVLEIADDLDTEEIRLPPMLIQPHLENAIWHGLRYKSGPKMLKVMIAEQPQGYLEVMIEDDGIGRAKSGELRQSRIGGDKHKSKGKQLSENRLELLKQSHPSASLVISDLYRADRVPAGTRVILVIPILNRKYVTPTRTAV